MTQAIDKIIKKKTELLTTLEAAELIDVEESTLRAWRCTKKEHIPFLKIGRNVRYLESDLLEWLESKRVA